MNIRRLRLPTTPPRYDIDDQTALRTALERWATSVALQPVGEGGGGVAGVESFEGRTGVVTAEQADYDGFFLTEAEADALYAALSHTHPQSDIDDLVADLAAKAPLASPVFTGDPQAPTPAPGDDDTSIATTAFVQAAIDAIGAAAGSMTETIPMWAGAPGNTVELDGILTGRLAIQYSLDGATGWDFVDGVDGAFVALETDGPQLGAWVDPEAAFTGAVDICFKIVTVSSTGTVADLANAQKIWKNRRAISQLRIGAYVETAGTVVVDPVISNVWIECNGSEALEDAEAPAPAVSCADDEYPVTRGLIFWGISTCIEAESDGTGLRNVNTILDQSGLGNDCGGDGDVSGAWVRRLVRNEDASAISQINGRDPIHFRDAWLPFPTDLFDGMTEGELFFVIHADNGDPAGLADRDYFHQLGPSDDARMAESTGGGANTGRIREDFGSTVLRDTGDFPGTLDEWFIYNVRATAGHHSIHKYTTAGGAQQAFSVGTNTVAFSTAPKLGNRGQNSDYLWVEGAIHNVIVTTAERASIISTLLGRHAI